MPISSLGTTPKQFIREVYTLTSFVETVSPTFNIGGYSRVFGYVEYDRAQVGLVGFWIRVFTILDPSLGGVPGGDRFIHCPTNGPGGDPGGPPAITFSFKTAEAAVAFFPQRQSPINPNPVPFRFCAYVEPVSPGVEG